MFDKLYKNIGLKLMTLAKVILCVGIIASIICGIIAWIDWWLTGEILDFVIFGVVPACLVYILSMFIYGFGQLVNDIHDKCTEYQDSLESTSEELPDL